jgi:hypothetical protein
MFFAISKFNLKVFLNLDQHQFMCLIVALYLFIHHIFHQHKNCIIINFKHISNFSFITKMVWTSIVNKNLSIFMASNFNVL